MSATDVVADASVVLKWFHAEGEEEVAESRALVDHHRRRAISVSVIDLTAYEIGNALLRGRLRLSAERVSIVIAALAEICPRVSLTTEELTDAARLAGIHGLTMYDAAYAAAALSRGGRLATLGRDLIAAGLGHRPSSVLSDLRLSEREQTAMTWSDDDLIRELARYQQACVASGMRPKAIHSYWDYANRFLQWRLGSYRPRGATSSGRPVPSAVVSTDDLRTQVDAYVRAVRAAGRAAATVETYERHALFFVRWLEGDFEPGARL
jgi:predicted nucleic acid-binding protein